MLMMYTIYHVPSVFPENPYVVRQVVITGKREPVPGAVMGTSPSLDMARSLVPARADACLQREPMDDPTIVETWF